MTDSASLLRVGRIDIGRKLALSVFEPLFFQIGEMLATLKTLGKVPASKTAFISLAIGLETVGPSLSWAICKNLDGMPQGEYSEVLRDRIKGPIS